MRRGNPLGWPVAACGRPLTRLPTSLNSPRCGSPGSLRCASLWFCFASVWLAQRRRPHYICRRRRQQWAFGIRDSALVTRNWQLATGDLQRRWAFLFLQILFNNFSSRTRSRTQRDAAWVQSALPGCALSLLCGCSNHHHFRCCCCCCCCFVRYSLGDIFWVSASGKSAVKGQLAARRSRQTSGLLLRELWEIRVPAK